MRDSGELTVSMVLAHTFTEFVRTCVQFSEIADIDFLYFISCLLMIAVYLVNV